MKNTDISYKNEELNVKFNFRVALICRSNNKILLQKSDKDIYWSLIGGRVKLDEDTKSAIIRECEEELGVLLKRDELCLIKVIENFFTYNQIKFHEILFIYTVDDNEILNKLDNFKTLDKEDVVNKWIDYEEINELDLQPTIVKSCYKDKTLSTELIGK